MCRRNHSYVFIMNNSVIISPYFGCFTGCILNLTNCKCSWRHDLLNKADIFQNDNDRTSCNAAYIIWNIYVHIYIEYSNAVRRTTAASVLGRPLCARRMHAHGSQWVPRTFWYYLVHCLQRRTGNPSCRFSVRGMIYPNKLPIYCSNKVKWVSLKHCVYY